MGDVLHLVAPDGIHHSSGGHIVQTMAVRAGDDGSIVAGFGAAFDFQAVDARVHDFTQVVDHAHIPGI